MSDSKQLARSGTAPAFRQLATRMATELLSDWVGEDRAGEAVGRIAASLSSAAASAKKPEDFYTCTPSSIANCVAISALTGIMPSSGSAALAYLIPRSPRKGEQKQLSFAFSHRGLNALAARSGQTMTAIPISTKDVISVTGDGEVRVEKVDFDNPPTSYDELRGIVVVVRRLDTGIVVCRGWVARKLIDARRDASDAYQYAERGEQWAKDSDPWHKWPVEMALKTAMHYAVSRGWCVIDDTSSVRALAAEATDIIEGRILDEPARQTQRISSMDELTDSIKSEPAAEASTQAEDATEQAADERTEASKTAAKPKSAESAANTAKPDKQPPEWKKSLRGSLKIMTKDDDIDKLGRTYAEMDGMTAGDLTYIAKACEAAKEKLLAEAADEQAALPGMQ